MMSGALHRRNRKDRAKARPLQKRIETVATDEIDENLIDSFPASDPPAWIPLARVGIPKRQAISRTTRKE
jgi:hypothetical protein